MRKPPPSRIKWLSLLLLSHLSHAKLIQWTINEEMEPGTKIIIDLPQELGLDRRPEGYTFKVVSQQQYLNINDDYELVTTENRIDRERICPNLFKAGEECTMDASIYTFNARSRKSETYTIRFIITDTNDNAPIFPNENINLEISESAQIGAEWRLESATDKDPDNGIKWYAIDDESMFELKEETNSDGSKIPKIRLLHELDSDKKGGSNYMLTLTASDGVNEGHTGVNITVKDINDNAPVWIFPADDGSVDGTPKVNVTVDEDAQIGFEVYTVRAEDRDSNLTRNGQVTYKFASLNNPYVMDHFEIDKQTGIITIKTPLDYDAIKTHNIYVSAMDGGTDKHVISATVTVNVRDKNDQSPEITENWLLGRGSEGDWYEMPEDIAVGTALFFVSVTDKDTNTNVETVIDQHADFFELVSQDKNQYLIQTKKEFDRETMSEYQLKLRATDDGNPPLSTTLDITIKLLDINDNDPTFKTSNYYTTIREDIDIGTVIFPDLKSMVVDQDAGENGTFYFKMDQLDEENNPVPSANQLFELRSNENGDWEIVLGKNGEQIDRDRGNSPANYSLKVTAFDNGRVTQRSSFAHFYVDVEDVDDNDPYFKQAHYTFPLDETLTQVESQVLVGQVTAIDDDRDSENKAIQYSINQAQPDDSFPFNLDEATGQIWTSRTLDRDSRRSNPKWNFAVVASNPYKSGSGPSQPVMAQVTIELLDKNDNKPTIKAIRPATSSTHKVRKGDEKGDIKLIIVEAPSQDETIIEKIIAVDDDIEGSNKDVMFLLENGDPIFKIDEERGSVSYVSTEKRTGCYPLTIIARNPEELYSNEEWDKRVIDIYLASSNENTTMIGDSCQNTSIWTNLADMQSVIFAVFIGVAIIVFILIVIMIIKCRWKKDKKGYAVNNNKKKAHLLSTTTHHDGTLDSRNDFEGDWNRPQNQAMSAAMSPTYHQRPMPGTQEPGNHSFTSKDSGTGDSVPTEHNQFLNSPEAMRFAQNQHKIGYGDESWATDSMMRNQSIQQQYHPVAKQYNLPHEEEIPVPLDGTSGTFSPYTPAHSNPQSLPPPMDAYNQQATHQMNEPYSNQDYVMFKQPNYDTMGSYRRSGKPTFSTFVDNHSETSSMSAALMNGHMSPDFDRIPSSANNTLERPHKNGHQLTSPSDYDETQSNIPATIPENNMNTFFPPSFEGH